MRIMMVATLILGLAQPVAAKPALRDVPSVDDGLFAVGVADIIRKGCPDISARLFRAVQYLRSLEAQARSLGYTNDEIDAHLDSDEEKERLRARSRVYFEQHGVNAGDTASLCTLGRKEIAAGSAIGKLLRARN